MCDKLCACLNCGFSKPDEQRALHVASLESHKHFTTEKEKLQKKKNGLVRSASFVACDSELR